MIFPSPSPAIPDASPSSVLLAVGNRHYSGTSAASKSPTPAPSKSTAPRSPTTKPTSCPGAAARARSARAGGSRDGEEEEQFAAASAAAVAKAAGGKTGNAWLQKLLQLQASNIEGAAGEGQQEEERRPLSRFSDDLFSEEMPKSQRSLEASVDETEDDNPPPPVIPFIKYASPGPPKSAWLSSDCTQPEFRILSLDGGGVRGTHLLRQFLYFCTGNGKECQ